MRKVLTLFIFLLLAASARAKDIYVAQNAAGAGSGAVGCSNAAPVGWFNNAANWGAGPAQIGPGTIVHLCGTFTGTPNEQLLTVQGNGTSTDPITIKFEPGAVLSAPYWGAAITMAGRSYIVVDGGGTGVIQNTANGSDLQYHANSQAIYAANCTGCTVENLTMANIYVHTSFNDVSVTQTFLNCIYLADADSFTISHVTCHDAGWAFNGAGNNLTLEYSQIYNIDHGLAYGPGTAMSGLTIHDNHFHDYANWDNSTNAYHHDGLHIWGQNGGSVSNGVIYNNLFDGDPGTNITAHIYLQDSVSNVSVFNNVFFVPATRAINVLWFNGKTGTRPLPGGPATNNAAYNNVIAAGGHNKGSALTILAQFNFTAANNILMGGVWDITFEEGGSLSPLGINNNIYEDLLADAGDLNSFGYQGKSFHDIQSWRSACGCDSNSQLVPLSKINVNSSGVLQSGSVAISTGSNLMQLATGVLNPLSHDRVGALRQPSGNWDVGAYKYGSAAKPAAPTGVTARIGGSLIR